MLPQDVLPTLRRSVQHASIGAVNIRLLGLLYTTHNSNRKKRMAQKRTWDESRSPQWRYLLGKDSTERRAKEKRAEQAEGELKRGVSKRKRASQERHRENRKLKSKSGKEIVYSASPGGENSRYHDQAFISRKIDKNNNEIFKDDEK